MRTQLIESTIIGLIIGAIVLAARWLFPNQPFIEIMIVLVGAGVLTILQIVLQRRRPHISSTAENPNTVEANPPTSEPATLLHSPHLEWADGINTDQLDPNSQTQASDTEQPIAIAEEADETLKKMV